MVLRSKAYRSKDSALKGIRAIKKNCKVDIRYLFGKSSNEMHYFSIKSANGLAVASSTMYVSEQERDIAIEYLKDNAAASEVVEQEVG